MSIKEVLTFVCCMVKGLTGVAGVTGGGGAATGWIAVGGGSILC